MGNLGVNFWLFRCSQVVIKMGYYSSSFAIMWWVLDKYHSASYVTFILASSMLVGMALRVVLSPLGDMFNKKRIVLLGTMIQFISYSIICIILFFFQLDISTIFFIELASAIGASFVEIGSVGMLPMLVKRDRLLEATKTIASLDSIVMLVGAPLGGFLLALLGVSFSFFFYSFMLLLSICLVCFISLSKNDNERPLQLDKKRVFLSDLKCGILFTWGNKITRTIFIFSLLIGMAFSCLQITMPYLIKVVHKLPAEYLGFVISSLGFGVVFSSIIISSVMRFVKNKKIVYFSAFLFVFSSVLLFVSASPIVYMISYFLLGVSKNFINIIVDTNLLIFLPKKDRTKVISNVVFCSNLAMPLTLVFSGEMIDFFGPSILMCIVVALFFISFLFIATAYDIGGFLDADSNSKDDFFNDNMGGL